jgi:hypothetical protein
MDALIYPYNLYLPKVQRQWHRASSAKPHDPEARFVYVDITTAPLSILESFKGLQGVWLRRAADAHLKSLARFTALSVVRLVEPCIASLTPLKHLSNLQTLSMEDPPVLHGLETLQNLRRLTMRHFRRINSLSAVAALSELRALSLSTIPSWDASRRCLQVESLEPLQKASRSNLWP